MNTTASPSLAIRPAVRDDGLSLRRLASLDSATVPEGPLLVAEWNGRLLAALSLSSGEAIADPFTPTAAAVDLLRMRARQLARSEHGPRRGLPARLRRRPAPAAAQ